MLTQEQLDRACADKLLRLWEPTDEAMKRCLYLTPTVRASISSFVAAVSSNRAAELIDDLDHYSAGRLLVVGAKGHIKRLQSPVKDDWNLRSTKEPHFRLIGAFAKADHFIALYGAPRSTFRAGWKKERLNAEQAWSKIFPGQSWHIGSVIGHYISENTDPDASKPVP